MWRALKESLWLGVPFALALAVYCWLAYTTTPPAGGAGLGAAALGVALGWAVGFAWAAALHDEDAERWRAERRELQGQSWARRNGRPGAN